MTDDRADEQIEAALLRMWDDGNASGLDGWIGPERGEEPDQYAIKERRKCVDRELDKLAGLLHTPTDQDNAGLAGRMARIAAIHRDDADDLRAKLERAEDEVAELRAMVGRLEAALNFKQGQIEDISRDCKRAEAEVAELRAQVAAVRALADEWRVRQNGRVRGFAARIDTALDTAGGEQQ